MGKAIMLVDDLEIALDLMRTILNKAGHSDILTYDCPRQALASIREGIVPAVIVTDFTMPGMNGLELLRAAQVIAPGTPGIIITGDPDRASAAVHSYAIIEKGRSDFFRQLIDTINRILAEDLTKVDNGQGTVPVYSDSLVSASRSRRSSKLRALTDVSPVPYVPPL